MEFCIFFFCIEHHGICCVAETREIGRGGRADLALALTSLHHTDTSGVDQRPLGQTLRRPQRPDDARNTAELEGSR